MVHHGNGGAQSGSAAPSSALHPFAPSDSPNLLWMGLMSGTSTDGVDGVIARFTEGGTCEVLADASLPLSGPLKTRLLDLQQVGPQLTFGASEDPFLALEQGINALTDVYADCAMQLLSGLPADMRSRVRAAGAHGQTLRHRPDLGVTLQHFNPARFHVRTGLSVVSDFRRADVALGGQGAPLVPAFHQWWIGGLVASGRLEAAAAQGVVVLNVGGFSNLTCLSNGHVIGFDSGPGNVLMDAWVQLKRGHAYDKNGDWAASGTVHPVLLKQCLSHPFFARPMPRSTGRDDFHIDWLTGLLRKTPGVADADVQATLLALTVQSIVDCIPGNCRRVLVCGGGARNGALMRALARALPAARVDDSESLGVPVSQMEAIAFAWLARQRLCGLPGNLPAVTGASATVMLGSLTGL